MHIIIAALIETTSCLQLKAFLGEGNDFVWQLSDGDWAMMGMLMLIVDWRLAGNTNEEKDNGSRQREVGEAIKAMKRMTDGYSGLHFTLLHLTLLHTTPFLFFVAFSIPLQDESNGVASLERLISQTICADG